MINYRRLLTSFLEAVTFLFSAFGGFLKNSAPPLETGVSYATGIASMLALLVLLLITALSGRVAVLRVRRNWIKVGAACLLVTFIFGIYYPSVLDRYTYAFPGRSSRIRHINGRDSDLTPNARVYVIKSPQATRADLEINLPDGDVWTSEGIERAKRILLISYLSLVLAISTGIFALLEAVSTLHDDPKTAKAANQI